jgi:hypothetical protein
MKPIAIILCSILVLTATGCERDTSITLRGGNPPKFVLSGSGGLTFLVINGPKQMREAPAWEGSALWEIEPSSDNRDNWRRLESIGTITYGQTPDGYRQKYPENGARAAPLEEGEEYSYWFVTVNANGASGRFRITNGKPELLANW